MKVTSTSELLQNSSSSPVMITHPSSSSKGLYKSFSKPTLLHHSAFNNESIKFHDKVEESFDKNMMMPLKILNFKPDEELTQEMKKAVISSSEALLHGSIPQAIDEGMGGSYFVIDRNSGQKIAVFKPSDEEPCAPNNPKGLTGKIGERGIKNGVRSGEQSIREVAAYKLDHNHLAGVPPTLLVELKFPRSHVQNIHPSLGKFNGNNSSNNNNNNMFENERIIGSFQLFAPSFCPSSDLSFSLFSLKDVQAIAAFDMRLINQDRHDGNILVRKNEDHEFNLVSYKLIPIDHGNCLPDNLNVSCFEWTWLTAPQLKNPIHSDVLNSIINLNIEKDVEELKQLGVRSECIRTMQISATFMKECCYLFKNKNITLYDIASMMCRSDFETPSELEKIVYKTNWMTLKELLHVKAKGNTFDDVFFKKFKQQIRFYLETKNPKFNL